MTPDQTNPETDETVTRRLTFEQIAITEDTGDPVLRGELPDTSSYLNAVLSDDLSTIRVTHVFSNRDGDMSTMLDTMVRQLDTTDVRFMVPLGKEFGSDLEDHLHGYEKTTEEHAHPTRGTIEVEVLVGEWTPDTDG